MSEGLSMSDILNRVLAHGLARRKVAKDIENGLQTTLIMHVQGEEIRSKREDGKCNPTSIDNIDGPCALCWSDEA